MRSDQAARDIRKKKTELISDAAQRRKIGQIEDAAQTAEYQDVLQQEADLTAGHGVSASPASSPSPRPPSTSWTPRSPRSSRPRSKRPARPAGSSASKPRRSPRAALPLCRTV
jgi:hypothetical protein